MQLSIAYLEDDPAQVELISSWFEEAGSTCKACPLGSEFIQALQKQNFDLLMSPILPTMMLFIPKH